METYLDNDCISVLNKYSRELNKEEINELIFEDLVYDFIFEFKEEDKYINGKYTIYDHDLSFTFEKPNNFNEDSTSLLNDLIFNWSYIHSYIGSKPDLEDKYELVYELSLESQDFLIIKNSLRIYEFIQNVFNNYYGFSENELEIIKDIINEF